MEALLAARITTTTVCANKSIRAGGPGYSGTCS
jgi:hypothetical protein